MNLLNTPTAIILNGVTSSGKTSIGKYLQQKFYNPFLFITGDSFRATLPPLREDLNWDKFKILENLYDGFYQSIPSYLQTGNHVIIDYVIENENKLKQYAKILNTYQCYFIGIYCSLEILEKREIERKDRMLGLAKMQYDKIHKHEIYDLKVDTSNSSIVESGDKIIKYIEVNPPKAFKILAE